MNKKIQILKKILSVNTNLSLSKYKTIDDKVYGKMIQIDDETWKSVKPVFPQNANIAIHMLDIEDTYDIYKNIKSKFNQLYKKALNEIFLEYTFKLKGKDYKPSTKDINLLVIALKPGFITFVIEITVGTGSYILNCTFTMKNFKYWETKMILMNGKEYLQESNMITKFLKLLKPGKSNFLGFGTPEIIEDPVYGQMEKAKKAWVTTWPVFKDGKVLIREMSLEESYPIYKKIKANYNKMDKKAREEIIKNYKDFFKEHSLKVTIKSINYVGMEIGKQAVFFVYIVPMVNNLFFAIYGPQTLKFKEIGVD